MPKPILHLKTNGNGKKSQGQRQAKRHENMCFLLNLATDLDEDFAEVNINDLVDTTISAFAKLLLDKNKMKMWHEFVELPEEQQEHLLKVAIEKMDDKKKKTKKVKKKNNKEIHKEEKTIASAERIKCGGSSNSCSSDDAYETFVIIENRPTTCSVNDENEHPSRRREEGDSCFRRIDPNIRYALKSMLKRHHLPLAHIMWFEDDIIPYFKEHPDSIYLRDLNNGFDRMLLHAVCQYLNLISKSFTRDGQRYTQVENRRINFVPPTILLSEYIKSLDGTIRNNNS